MTANKIKRAAILSAVLSAAGFAVLIFQGVAAHRKGGGGNA